MPDEPTILPGEAKQLIRQLRLASARAIREIRNPPGKSESSKSFNATRAAQRLKQFNEELKQLEHRAVRIANSTVRKAFDQGLKDADEQLRSIGLRDNGPISASFAKVETRRAAVLVRQTADDLGNAVRSIGENTRKIVRQTHALGLDPADVNRLIAGATIEGKPAEALRELRAKVKAAAIDGKTITVNTKTGVIWEMKPDTYAELVFQTKIAEATNIAELERLRARGRFYVRIIGSNSFRFCTEFVGKVYYIGEGEDPEGIYPSIRVLPEGGAPFHARCTKRYVPFIPSLATPKQIEESKPTDKTKSLHGKSPTEAQKKYFANNPDKKKAAAEEAKRARAEAAKKPAAKPKSQEGTREKDAASPSSPASPAERPSAQPSRPSSEGAGRERTRDEDPSIDSTALPKTEIGARVRRAIDAASSVHRSPGFAPTTVRVAELPENVQGEFGIEPDGTMSIEISTKAATPGLTTLHELGHRFAHGVTGSVSGPATDPALARWREAVDRSSSKRLLDAVLDAGGMSQESERQIIYAASWKELFARSYAQWVTVRSADSEILKELEARKRSLWDDADFEEIEEEFTDFVRAKGLLP